MVPFVVVIISLLVFRGLGALGVGPFASWPNDAAYALAVMFLLTATIHFTGSKADLIRMVPRAFPRPDLIVLFTGICEIAGAIGLLIPPTRLIAGIALALLLVAMFPANVSAALRDVSLRGSPPTPLWQRIPMQIVFIGLTLWAALG